VGVLAGERGQSLAARLGAHHAAALERLRGPGDDELDPLAGTAAASRSRLTEAVVALVTAASTVRQLLVVIEDAQWLDDASAAMLQALAERVAPGDLGRVMLVLTTREGAPAVDVATRLELEPLPPARVRELVEDVVGLGAAPASFVARAAELSRGNGLFVCELLRLCVDRELIVRRGRGWFCDEEALAAAALPLTTAELIAARIALLPPSLRRLLWLAAIVGGAIETAVLEALVGADARAALADLTSRQFLVAEGPAYRFDHVEVQVGALRDLALVDEGPALHRRVADELSARGAHPADVARLYLASDEPARALAPLVAAGERAAAVYDYGAAVAHYDAALALGGPSLAVHVRRLAAIRRGGLGGVDARADEALGLARQSGGDAERDVRLSLALLALQRGGFAEALAHADALGAVAGDAASAARVEAHRIAGLARCNLGDLAGALARLDEAVAGAGVLGDAVLSASARNDRGFVHGYAGAHAHAVADHEAALAALEQAHSATVAAPHAWNGPRAALLDALAATRNNLGFVCWHLGRYDAARAHLEEALTLRRRLADLHGEGVTRNNIANVLRHRGELEAAAAEYHAAIDLCRRSGNVLYEAIALNNLGQIEEEEDCFAEAAELYRRALGLVEQLGDRIREGDNLGNLGICALRAGDHEAARDFLARSVALRRAIGDRAYLVLDLSFLARALVAGGNRDEARAAVDEALGVVAAGQEGIEQMQAVYLNAHLVFDALGEGERAHAALVRAGALARSQADSLDSAARAAFFARVRVNREIVAHCRAAALPDPSAR
jgi:tetratricopeptide (TPR) repeat protein